MTQELTAIAGSRIDDRFVNEVARNARISGSTERRVILDLKAVQVSSSAHQPIDVLIRLATVLGGASPRSTFLVSSPGHLSDALARSGILFAIANRTGVEVLFDGEDQGQLLKLWRTGWTPNRPLDSLRLLPLDSGSPNEMAGTLDCWSFINPHRVVDASELEGTGVFGQESPWVKTVLTRFAGGLTVEDRAKVGKVVAYVIHELAKNFHHAFSGMTNTDDAHRARSLVQVWVTKGSPNRIHVLTIDFGLGIIRTLRPKLKGSSGAFSSAAMLRMVLDGNLPSYDNGSGEGYKKIKELTDTLGGRVWLTTSAWNDPPDKDESGKSLPPITDSSTCVIATRIAGKRKNDANEANQTKAETELLAATDAFGTAVHVSIDIPPRNRKSSSGVVGGEQQLW
jgi:hypothetical protein